MADNDACRNREQSLRDSARRDKAAGHPIECLHSVIEDLLNRQGCALVALDGPSCAGKTTQGRALCERYGGSLFHMDDFFLPPSLRTAARYAEPGGNVHYERFSEEVLTPLRQRREVMLRRFCCGTMTLSPPEPVPFRPVTVIEGAYSLHPCLRDAYDLKVFIEIPKELQRRRLFYRNGESGAQNFLERWVPLEEHYFAHCEVPRCADLILDASYL